MLVCHNCAAENRPNEAYCLRCGELLRPINSTRRGDTSVIEDQSSPEIPRRRWGTSRFDAESIMLLSVQGYDAQPIRVDLEHDKTLGRTDQEFVPDINLDNFDAFERGVSRQHARLRRQNDTVVIIDLNSANSTFLNGQRLAADQPRILRDGDEIRLGQLVLRITFEDVFDV
jgi:hypothetical protein